MSARFLPELAASLNHLADLNAAGVPDAELLRRFADTRDEAAFELLVWRYAALVLGTCRRTLPRSADAEDAFQATFLALARSAGSVRSADALGGWLHRVAARAALRIRASAGRARLESHPLTDVAAPEAPLPDDTAEVLDEEIARLPDKLRVAFVLCHLQGHTHEEAATQLGCPKGTVLSRVARARARLQATLTRRGFAVSAAGTFAVVPSPTVSAELVKNVVKASVAFATKQTVAAASSQAVTLARGVLRGMTFDVLKPVAAVLAVAALAVGAVLAVRSMTNTDLLPNSSAQLAQPAALNIKLDITDKGVVSVDNLIFSPDGKWVVVSGTKPNGKKKPDTTTDSALVVWEAATGKHVHTFVKPAHIDLWPRAFSPDGKLFATTSSDNQSVTVWSTDTWKEHAKLAHPMPSSASFSPDGKLILTTVAALHYSDGKFSGPYSKLKVWDVATGNLVWEQESKTKDEALFSQVFAPDSKTIAGGTQVGSVRLLDAKTGKQRTVIRTPERELVLADFSPNGAKLLTWTPDLFALDRKAAGALRLWNIATGKQEQQFEGIDRLIQCAAFSPDGKLVAAQSGGVVWVWDAATGKKITHFFVLSQADDIEEGLISFTPDSKVIVVCWQEKKNKSVTIDGVSYPFRTRDSALYAVPSGKELIRLPGAKIVTFDRDGKTVAIVSGQFRRDDSDKPDEVTIRDLADLLKSQAAKDK